MSQRFFSSTMAGDLRFIARAEFAGTSFPQPPCARCKWTRDCRDWLEPNRLARLQVEERDEGWLVRDWLTATSDGHAYQRCARDFKEKDAPPDVKIHMRKWSARMLEEHVGIPGHPGPRPREEDLDRRIRERMRRAERQMAEMPTTSEAVSA